MVRSGAVSGVWVPATADDGVPVVAASFGPAEQAVTASIVAASNMRFMSGRVEVRRRVVVATSTSSCIVSILADARSPLTCRYGPGGGIGRHGGLKPPFIER